MNHPEGINIGLRQNSVCDGTNKIKRCCKKKNGPCTEGEGDCNKDSECGIGLECGHNNCLRDFNSPEAASGKRHDCCFGKYIKVNQYNIRRSLYLQLTFCNVKYSQLDGIL